ncbi:hypothetical protein ACFSSC_10110 [Corynebacterium mendelii]|uniref:Uncharacterized protein n=1 Tax=Corynebacterium mendelii TaxID=2765362 RepID=A0A939E261_9CORY|nr:hypothetical protein [Corynebacterium mendelii]MBN9644403.1 hypothetical protein [Corynebacterium mendelii]
MSSNTRTPYALVDSLGEFEDALALVNAIRVSSGLPEFAEDRIPELRAEWEYEEQRARQLCEEDARAKAEKEQHSATDGTA